MIDENFRDLIVMFAVFIFFLLPWIISVSVIVILLSDILARAKISVKLIPAVNLIEIKDTEKNNKAMQNENKRSRKKRD